MLQRKSQRILCSVTFSRKSYRLLDNVGKYGTARLASLYRQKSQKVTTGKTQA